MASVTTVGSRRFFHARRFRACRLPSAVCRLHFCRLPSAVCRLLSAVCLLPTAHCPLPTLLSSARRGKKNLLVQVGGWITRHANMRHVFEANPGFPQTVTHRLRRKPCAVLYAIKTFFLNGRDD